LIGYDANIMSDHTGSLTGVYYFLGLLLGPDWDKHTLSNHIVAV